MDDTPLEEMFNWAHYLLILPFPSYKDTLSFELNPANPATTLGQ
jgi:hypothetical protein